MGKRKVVIRQSVARSIAEAAWFIESKGLLATAEKFTDDLYDFIQTLEDNRFIHALCKDPSRSSMGLKCITFKKYTTVFIETDKRITITEFLPSKLIRW